MSCRAKEVTIAASSGRSFLRHPESVDKMICPRCNYSFPQQENGLARRFPFPTGIIMDYEKWEAPQSISGRADPGSLSYLWNQLKRRPTLSFGLFGLEKRKTTLSFGLFGPEKRETTLSFGLFGPEKRKTTLSFEHFGPEKRKTTLSFGLFGLEKCRSTLSMAFYENVRPETTV